MRNLGSLNASQKLDLRFARNHRCLAQRVSFICCVSLSSFANVCRVKEEKRMWSMCGATMCRMSLTPKRNLLTVTPVIYVCYMCNADECEWGLKCSFSYLLWCVQFVNVMCWCVILENVSNLMAKINHFNNNNVVN